MRRSLAVEPVGRERLLGDRRQRRCAHRALVSTYGRSKIRSASSVRKISATRIAGLSSGSVMRTKRCQAVAPSTLAAS